MQGKRYPIWDVLQVPLLNLSKSKYLIHFPSSIGLDPSNIFFRTMPTFVRLDPSDAQFVDVLHTDAGALGISTICRL